jgi:sulfotransferase family protein
MGYLDSEILRQANDLLGSLDLTADGFTADLRWQPCFIAAPPRGGSTLLQQVLISSFRLGYVSNIMARFWNAPAVGAALHVQLTPEVFTSSFASQFGNTEGIFEPHEWGWFWRKWLSLEGDEHHVTRPVDWPGLSRALGIVEHTLEAPLLFDSPLAASNLMDISAGLGSILVLNLTRSPWHICNSLLNARIERYGTLHTYYGAHVRDQAALNKVSNPIEQIVLQARTLIDEQAMQVSQFSPEQVLDLKYEDLRARPMMIVEAIASFYKRHGIPLKQTDELIAPFPDRNRNAHINLKFTEELSSFVERIFGAGALPG